MVLSIDGKADDPHGSESHSSEVVHEEEDAEFGDTTHDSVNTESATVTNEVDSGSVSTGTVDSDSVNTESATVTNEVDAGSVNTGHTESESATLDSLSGGVAGDNNEITVIPDNDGEMRCIGIISMFDQAIDISSTDYVEITGSGDGTRAQLPTVGAFSNTNINTEQRFGSIQCVARGDEGSIRIADQPDTELTGEAFDSLQSDVGEFVSGPAGSENSIRLQAKVEEDGNTATFDEITVAVYEQIERDE